MTGRTKKHLRTGAYVYILGPRSDSRFIKVGKTSLRDPRDRARYGGLRKCVCPRGYGRLVAGPRDIILHGKLRFATSAAALRWERAFHRRHRSSRVVGEWYPRNKLAAIKRIFEKQMLC